MTALLVLSSAAQLWVGQVECWILSLTSVPMPDKAMHNNASSQKSREGLVAWCPLAPIAGVCFRFRLPLCEGASGFGSLMPWAGGERRRPFPFWFCIPSKAPLTLGRTSDISFQLLQSAQIYPASCLSCKMHLPTLCQVKWFNSQGREN